VRPLRQRTDATVDEFLDSAGVAVVPIDRAIARRAPRSGPSIRRCGFSYAMSRATRVATDSMLLTLDKKLRQLPRRVEPPSHA